MNIKKESQSNTRLLIATSLFLLSIAASFVISYISTTGEKYWVANKAIPAGAQINSSDISLIKVSLGKGISGYLPTAHNPIGSIARRVIHAGELIYGADLSSDISDLDSINFSISVRSADFPTGTGVGDLISIFQVFDARNGEVLPTPEEVVGDAFIQSISERGANFGGEIILTLSLDRSALPRLLAATSQGRLVVVSSHG